MSVIRVFCLLALLGSAAQPALSQGQIYRCGNEYTNDIRQAQQRNCLLIDAGPVTVTGTQVMRAERPGQRLQATTPIRPENRPAVEQTGVQTRVSVAEQRARDTDARFILEAELRKAEARLVQLQTEFNNGEPEKQGIEGRNHQRYLDRVQSMREALARQQSDITSLKRELSRLPGGSAVASNP